VLAYAVVSSNEQCETVWYLNTRGEVGQEALGLRDGWRQSDRFRYGEEKTVDEFRHLFLEPANAPRLARLTQQLRVAPTSAKRRPPSEAATHPGLGDWEPV
jgi:hypothetical protein